ncbi:hypothetical protein [Mycoplasmopsis gallinacea]|uniref:Uncharacterized protein n=1 Tax=Mycoplasmopsis gallinacea TaxID=29556 RepID=A0A449A3F9_9BACT|nr:hypothetical protein [Mycoplasmopsis gallinacea]VEU58734.1 Uncharacterised protein [Mycoplasmopsis gallinacea]
MQESIHEFQPNLKKAYKKALIFWIISISLGFSTHIMIGIFAALVEKPEEYWYLILIGALFFMVRIGFWVVFLTFGIIYAVKLGKFGFQNMPYIDNPQIQNDAKVATILLGIGMCKNILNIIPFVGIFTSIISLVLMIVGFYFGNKVNEALDKAVNPRRY